MPLCDDANRRARVRAQGLAGIDHITAGTDRRSLTVEFFGTLPGDLDASTFRVEGGQQVTGIRVVAVDRPAGTDEDPGHRLHLTLDRHGDPSAYRLRALGDGFDPRYAAHPFTFRPPATGNPDCKAAAPPCPPPARTGPAIDYLAKDYASFRRLLLDRFALTMPGWSEQHAPDLGVTLVELLAYVGDRLSYQQDAVATEAYLDTARLRTSVRRHARLVDYPMHEGCAARTFVCVETEDDVVLSPEDVAFAAVPPGRSAADGAVIPPEQLRARGQVRFRPLQTRSIHLRPGHNRIELWTWGGEQCRLPAGATEATLRDRWTGKDGTERLLHLVPGDVIVLEEERGPVTGAPADADPGHRQAVRLTRVTTGVDPLGGIPVVEVAWAAEDALTFPLSVSARSGPGCEDRPVAVARGNTVLVEHGLLNTWGPGGGGERFTVPAGPAAGPADCTPPGFGCPDPDPRPAPGPACVHTLQGRDITWSTPFPAPAGLAAAQARALTALPERARRRLRGLRDVPGPLPEDGRAFLDMLFGKAVPESLRPDRDPGRALDMLFSRFDHLLAPKLRRLDTLVRQARSGRVLGPADIGWEIRQTWGEEAWDSIDPAHPARHGPARRALRTDPRRALPVLTVRADDTQPERAGTTDPPGAEWTPRRDLLSSGPRDRHMVPETDDEGATSLRFGDGRSGEAPLPGTALTARYSAGNGSAGNIGAEAINRIALRSTTGPRITRVRNPLPATGGTDPEPVDAVRRLAPRDPFQRLQRAVTAEDYAALAGDRPGVQRTAATLRWTGSWYEADIAVDALGTPQAPPHLLDDVRQAMHRYRRIGHDVITGPAVTVPLDVALTVQVDPSCITAHVQQELLRTLRPGRLPDGRPGFFDPDALSFGTPVHTSRLIATVVAVPGVRCAQVTLLRRHGDTGAELPPSGTLAVRPLEIPRMDDDPAHPEHGRLTLVMEGGR
ncbi:putative baseplate assembly protein [Streptomyces roseoverticillatus]|nr:putative baseplate assembly protein [Streptomyces roseoverticillatus]